MSALKTKDARIEAQRARIEALEAAGKRLADAAEHDVNSIGGKWSMNTENAITAWREAEKGDPHAPEK